jgi:hypothetical protein
VLIRTLTLDTIVVNTAEVTLVGTRNSISDAGLGTYNVIAAIPESIGFTSAQGAARDLVSQLCNFVQTARKCRLYIRENRDV